MRYKRHLYGSNWIALTLLLLMSPYGWTQVVVDLSRSVGFGVMIESASENTMIPLKNKAQIRDIRVDSILADPFDPARIEVITTHHDLLFNVCMNGIGMYLVPILTEEEPLCHVSEEVDFSHTRIYGIANDRVQIDNIRFDSTIPDPFGSEKKTVTTYHNIVFRFDPDTLNLVALFAFKAPPQQIRIELNWGNNPRDLDAHLTGPAPGEVGTYNNESERFHLYFGNKQADVAAFSKISQFSDEKPEAMVIFPSVGMNTLRQGVYQFSVHHFSGGGSLDTSEANVKIWVNNEIEPSQVFTPPPDHLQVLSGKSNDVWTVFALEVNQDGMVIVVPLQSYSNSVNPYGVVSNLIGRN